MAIRIDVISTIPDARAAQKLKSFRELVSVRITDVRIADSYTIDTKLTASGIAKARKALTNSRVEGSHLGRWLPDRFTFAVEIGFVPGVTDNVGMTAQEAIEDARRKGVETEFRPDGTPMFTSRAHKGKYLRAYSHLGIHNLDGGYSD